MQQVGRVSVALTGALLVGSLVGSVNSHAVSPPSGSNVINAVPCFDSYGNFTGNKRRGQCWFYSKGAPYPEPDMGLTKIRWNSDRRSGTARWVHGEVVSKVKQFRFESRTARVEAGYEIKSWKKIVVGSKELMIIKPFPH